MILIGGRLGSWGSILTHTGAVSSYSSQNSSSSSKSSSSLSWQPSDWHAGSQQISSDQFCGWIRLICICILILCLNQVHDYFRRRSTMVLCVGRIRFKKGIFCFYVHVTLKRYLIYVYKMKSSIHYQKDIQSHIYHWKQEGLGSVQRQNREQPVKREEKW